MGFSFLPPRPNNIFLLAFNILKYEAHKEVILYWAYKVNINRMKNKFEEAKSQEEKTVSSEGCN